MRRPFSKPLTIYPDPTENLPTREEQFASEGPELRQRIADLFQVMGAAPVPIYSLLAMANRAWGSTHFKAKRTEMDVLVSPAEEKYHGHAHGRRHLALVSPPKYVTQIHEKRTYKAVPADKAGLTYVLGNPRDPNVAAIVSYDPAIIDSLADIFKTTGRNAPRIIAIKDTFTRNGEASGKAMLVRDFQRICGNHIIGNARNNTFEFVRSILKDRARLNTLTFGGGPH